MPAPAPGCNPATPRPVGKAPPPTKSRSAARPLHPHRHPQRRSPAPAIRILSAVEQQLRLSRLGAFDAALAAIRADAATAAARKAGDHDRAARHETLAASYWALRDHYQQREHDLAQDMTARQEWEHATERSRRLAIAADAELRRRHPGRKTAPLRSAEPVPASDPGCGPLHPAADGKLTEIAALIRGPAVQREEFRAEMDERRRLIVPGEDHGTASRAMKAPGQHAILQPPKPEITPSARILQLAAEHDIEPEAGG